MSGEPLGSTSGEPLGSMSGEPLGSTLGALDADARETPVHTSPTTRSGDFTAPLERPNRAYGPTPGQARKPAVLVLDNGPIRTSRARLAALAARQAWRAVERLPAARRN